MSEGEICPKSYHCSANLTSVDDAIEYPAGHYCEEGSVFGAPYPFATFSSAKMNDKITECQDCTAGFACDTKGLSLPEKQCARSTDQRPNEGKCTAGHYCEVGSEMEQPCEAGYYIPFELAE